MMMREEWLKEPAPILRRPKGPNYPVHALGEILAPAAERIAYAVGVPQAMAAQSLLAASALAVQPHANVHIDGRIIPLSLYLITIAESGSRKSASDHQAMASALRWEELQWKKHAIEFSAYMANKRASRSASPMLDEDRPRQPRLITSEPTIEALIKGLYYDYPSMGLFNDDAGQLIGGSSMVQENRLKTIATLSVLWDGKAIDRSRSGKGESFRAYHRRLSMHLMMQPVLGESLLNDKEMNGQGILARCLISWPDDLFGTRMYKSVDLTQDVYLQRYRERISSLLEQPWPVESDGALRPSPLHLSDEAKLTWCAFHNEIEYRLKRYRELDCIRPYGAKAAENVLRIAGVFAGLEECKRIEADHILRSTALVSYYLDETRRVSLGVQHEKLDYDADKLLRWLARRRPKPFKASWITQYGPSSCRRSVQYARNVLAALQTDHWLIIDENGLYKFSGDKYLDGRAPDAESQ